MLSEGIHSAVAAGNDGLLLIGMKMSQRPPDSQHPFGYSQEIYIWSMIVAVSILGLGGGVSLAEGVRHIMKPQPIEKPMFAYIALGAAMLFDIITLLTALKQFRAATEGKSLWRAINTAKDPNPLVLLGENSAAILGRYRIAHRSATKSSGLSHRGRNRFRDHRPPACRLRCFSHSADSSPSDWRGRGTRNCQIHTGTWRAATRCRLHPEFNQPSTGTDRCLIDSRRNYR